MSICNAKKNVYYCGLKILILKTFGLQIRMDEEWTENGRGIYFLQFEFLTVLLWPDFKLLQAYE